MALLYHIVSYAKRVFVERWKVLVLIVLLMWMLGWAIVYGLTPYLDQMPLVFENGSWIIDANVVPSMDMTTLWEIFGPYMGVLLGVGILVVIGVILLQILVMRITFDTITGSVGDYHHLLQKTVHRLVPYLGTSILQGIFLFFLYILLIVPGIIYSIYRLFTTAVVVYDDRAYKAAMNESKRIVKGRWWWTLLYLIIISGTISLIHSLLGWAVSFIPQIELVEGITSLLQHMFQVIAMVFIASFFLVWRETALSSTLLPEEQ